MPLQASHWPWRQRCRFPPYYPPRHGPGAGGGGGLRARDQAFSLHGPGGFAPSLALDCTCPAQIAQRLLAEWEGGPAFPRPQPTPSSLSQPPLSTTGWLAGVLPPCLAEHTTPGCSKLSCFLQFPLGMPQDSQTCSWGRGPQDGWISMEESGALVTPAPPRI